ncbi:hypothetical protein OMK64_01660 [Cellulomonas fimi]|uniref:hypothetical protein n=1 Tax=Cellulomonas fimi TaxID=1708 RepID=UPI00234C4DB0|nr:hypothetical protein [Cellulomonas fimi]MDC7120238.1 hypothetical protein [Cellulomonas fimi]
MFGSIAQGANAVVAFVGAFGLLAAIVIGGEDFSPQEVAYYLGRGGVWVVMVVLAISVVDGLRSDVSSWRPNWFFSALLVITAAGSAAIAFADELEQGIIQTYDEASRTSRVVWAAVGLLVVLYTVSLATLQQRQRTRLAERPPPRGAIYRSRGRRRWQEPVRASRALRSLRRSGRHPST